MTNRALRIVAPAVVLAIFVGLWQLSFFNTVFDLPEFAVPLPDQILSAASLDRAELVTAFTTTIQAVVLGWTAGNTLGFTLAVLLLTLSPRVARRVEAFFGGFQALPIIAVAPLVALWISDSLLFKVTTVTIMVFPQMLVYAYRGLNSVDSSALDLARSYDASGWQVFRFIRLPVALANVFTSLRYSIVLALIGSVVCEILRSADGLGYAIHESLQLFNAPLAWSAVVVLALLGVLSYGALSLLERLVLPWMFRRG